MEDANICRGLILGVEETTPRNRLLKGVPVAQRLLDVAAVVAVMSDGVHIIFPSLSISLACCFPPGVVIIEKSSEFVVSCGGEFRINGDLDAEDCFR